MERIALLSFHGCPYAKIGDRDTGGMNIYVLKLAEELGPNHTIVTILCDSADKYRSKLFNKKFLLEKGLPFPKWL